MVQENQCPIMTTNEPQQRGSQVAACLRAIAEEYSAAQGGMSGYAETSRHAYITARMEKMGSLADELTEMVEGDRDRAMSLVIGCMQQVEAQGHA